MTERTGNLVLDVIGWTLVGVSAIAAVGALGCVVAYSIGRAVTRARDRRAEQAQRDAAPQGNAQRAVDQLSAVLDKALDMADATDPRLYRFTCQVCGHESAWRRDRRALLADQELHEHGFVKFSTKYDESVMWAAWEREFAVDHGHGVTEYHGEQEGCA